MRSKTRRAICDGAKGASGDYIASAVFYNYPDSKRWVDAISLIKNRIMDEEYHALNESLDLRHGDAIFIGVRPDTFTVDPPFNSLITGWIDDAWTGQTPSVPLPI